MLGHEQAIANQVKLVIWDLDDTLWRGTISEGEISYVPSRVDAVRELNRRGIVNSISSKNDHDVIRSRLEADGLWSEFVFASINWLPKGLRIAQTIEDMQLRPANVLFVDDNELNLREAEHYAPGLMTALPDVLETLLDHPHAAGAPDPELKRLKQYQLLERKALDRRESSHSSNEEFLAECDIHIYLGDDCRAHASRLIDLLNRSNQLNFTKRRFTEETFAALLEEPERQTRYVQVSDKYGDYGIIGIYSLANGRLDDFTFSCRTMNMGIEQWVYAHLGFPVLDTVGDVSSTLGRDDVDWITLDAAPNQGVRDSSSEIGWRGGRTLLKGGCDLEAVADLLVGDRIETEVNYTNADGQWIQSHHTETLRRSSVETIEEYGEVIDRLPFVDRDAYHSGLTEPDGTFGTVIYSLILDYTQNLYRLRGTDFVVPFEQLHLDATDEATWPRILGLHASNGVTESTLRWFAEHFEACGPVSPDAFQANVEWIVSTHPRTRFVLLNAPELAIDNPMEPDRHRHHQVLNDALDEALKDLPNAQLCDLREIISSPDDLTIVSSANGLALNLRHYSRGTYMRIAERISDLGGIDASVVPPPMVRRVRHRLGEASRSLRFRLLTRG